MKKKTSLKNFNRKKRYKKLYKKALEKNKKCCWY